MTAQRDFDRQLASWFDEIATFGVPEGLLERSLDRVGATRQRPGWLVRDRGRRPRAIGRQATTPAWAFRVLALAAAVIVVVAGASLFLKLSPALIVGPSSPPGPTPSACVSPSQPAATPTQPNSTSTPLNPTPTGQAALTGPIGDGRQIHTATLLADGCVLVVGGYALDDLPLASTALYDPKTNTFRPTGSLATARGFHTATLLDDGRVLITGGGPTAWNNTGALLTSAELYDPTTGTFSPTGSMATPREGHTATLLADGRVLIVGGIDLNGHAVTSAELYDPTTGTFSPTGSMAAARGFHTATLLADGRVLIAGGAPAAWISVFGLASAEIYNPTTGTFSATGSMTTARGFHTATLLADGRVLIAGGDSRVGGRDSAELYDPTIGTFSPTGSMSPPRQYTTATLLLDGRVLFAGGGGDYTNLNFLASAEIYDPTTGTFTSTGSMADARTYHTATLLPNGRVLVTGGYGALAPLASAEIYDPTTGTFSPAGLQPQP
jgi:Galactose oxidase, central domain